MKSHKQTIAYDHFWHTTKQASDCYKSPDGHNDIEEKSKSLLDINPEGSLLGEIKDIQDELDLMINIKSKQQRVFKEFNKNVKLMIAHGLALSEELGTAKPADVAAGQTGFEGDQTVVASIPSTDAQWTLQFGFDLAARLDDRVEDLRNLKASAERAEKAVCCFQLYGFAKR
jgi:hypothetical protein